VLVLQIRRPRATLRFPAPGRADLRIVSLLVQRWLVIGAFAAYQRNYFANDPVNCAQLTTVVVTIIAGPLNYLGVNPKINCTVPQPSQ